MDTKFRGGIVDLEGYTLIDSENALGLYPVGSVYISVNNTSPAQLFGGTWEKLKDRFLLGAGDTYKLKSTGGEATHTLTNNEIPSHSHDLYNYYNSATALEYFPVNINETKTGWAGNAKTSTYGGGQAHNNMPPYLVVNFWKRTK